MSVAVPAADGVKVTEQETDEPLPESVQVPGAEPAEPVRPNATVPVGVVGLAPVSVTVAVQVEGVPITTFEFGEQATTVDVGRRRR